MFHSLSDSFSFTFLLDLSMFHSLFDSFSPRVYTSVRLVCYKFTRVTYEEEASDCWCGVCENLGLWSCLYLSASVSACICLSAFPCYSCACFQTLRFAGLMAHQPKHVCNAQIRGRMHKLCEQYRYLLKAALILFEIHTKKEYMFFYSVSPSPEGPGRFQIVKWIKCYTLVYF